MSKKKIDDGGQAFPTRVFRNVVCQNGYGEVRKKGMSIDEGGMSLRDYFAGQALIGDIATFTTTDPTEYAECIAKRCYALADAMLKARQQ